VNRARFQVELYRLALCYMALTAAMTAALNVLWGTSGDKSDCHFAVQLNH
jgi:hypothetical protein